MRFKIFFNDGSTIEDILWEFKSGQILLEKWAEHGILKIRGIWRPYHAVTGVEKITS